MSDTMTVWKLCDHRRVDSHDWDYMTGEFRCPGGKEIVLRIVPNTGRKLLDGTTVPYWMVETTDE